METKRKLKIWRDTDSMNPFEDWDCNPDLMTTNKDYSEGEILTFIQEQATEGKVLYNQKKIACILDLDLDNYTEFDKYEKVEEIKYYFQYANIEQLGELCELFKIPYTQYTSRGYSQGDWSEVLIVLTDSFFKKTGCKTKDKKEILKGTADLFDNWAWGDVYGFSIVEIQKCNLGCEHEEIIDSCGGFYGDNFEKNGMIDNLPKELHEELKNYNYSDIEY